MNDPREMLIAMNLGSEDECCWHELSQAGLQPLLATCKLGCFLLGLIAKLLCVKTWLLKLQHLQSAGT